ncbi:MAG: phosphatidylserine/phosphatidylglycerophosphate/cardiolipin synthase family protein [Actinobacteria bacterium]|nr:phosphatidylserine/phosphatidylglycerophosphate/cardiolipin synthase family protein [Actinomycetota bacterium]
MDEVLGDGIERAWRAHHARRLTRLGHGRALDPPAGGWADGGSFPARAGNEVELLVDGAEAFPRVAADVRAAQSHVHVAGWFFTPGLLLGPDGPTVGELLADAAERVPVRVLAWAGAPLPLFHPDRAEVRAMRDALVRGTRIEMAVDPKERPMHCHHEKLVLVDDRVAYVGGIDLTTYAGDRFDDGRHAARGDIGWHDAAMRIEGPVVADVAEHFRLRWRAVAGDVERPVVSGAAGGRTVQLVRTVPERVYPALERGEFTILESYLRALRSAERLVYIESQFLWSSEVVAVLAEKLRNPPRDEFRVVVVLPSKPNNGGEDTRGQIGVLVDADVECGDGTSRFLACTLYQPGRGGVRVYVHAKIAIVDDHWLTIGSANLNEHSLFNDTEVNVVLDDAELARAARLRLWSEHLECAFEDVDRDPADVVDEVWRPRAEEEHARRLRDGYVERRVALLPHISRRAQALWGPLSGLLVDG